MRAVSPAVPGVVRRATRLPPGAAYHGCMSTGTSGFMDGKPMELSCDVCGSSLHTTVGEARQASALQCPNGHPLTFEAGEFDESIRQVEERVAKIMRSFRF